MKKLLISAISIILITILIMPPINAEDNISSDNKTNTFFGFLIDVHKDQVYSMQNNISKLINKLIENDVTIYWLSSDATIKVQELWDESKSFSKSFKKGSFMALFSSDSSYNKVAASYVYMFGLSRVQVYKITEKTSNIDAYKIVRPKIAYLDVLNSNITTWTPYYMLSGGFPNIDLLDWDEILNKLNNKDYNLFICGGATWDDVKASGSNIFELNRAINKISKFIKNGGGYVGSCFGAYLASSGIVFPINILHSYFPRLPLLNIGFIGCDFTVVNALPGGGSVLIESLIPDHPVYYGVNKTTRQFLAQGGPIINWCGKNTKKIAVLDSVLDDDFDWWDGDSEYDKYTIPQPLRKTWIKYSLNKAMIVESTLGKGKVVSFGTHPEFGVGWGDSYRYWGESYRLMFNSIFYTTCEGPNKIDASYSDHFSFLDVDAGGPYAGVIDIPIKFSGKVKNGTAPYNWYWEFEVDNWYFYRNTDKTYSTEQNPTFTYTNHYDNDKTLKTSLLVTDANGNFGTSEANISIYYEYKEPLIRIEMPNSGYVGDEINFSCIVKDGIPPFEYHWDFGDERQSLIQNPSHNFTKAGNYNITLVVRDQWGTEKTIQRTIIIKQIIDDGEIIKHKDDGFPIYHAILVFFIMSCLVIIYIRRKKIQ